MAALTPLATSQPPHPLILHLFPLESSPEDLVYTVITQ